MNPGHDTCILEHNALQKIASVHPGLLAEVKVEKYTAVKGCKLPGKLRKIEDYVIGPKTRALYVKCSETLFVKCTILTSYDYIIFILGAKVHVFQVTIIFRKTNM